MMEGNILTEGNIAKDGKMTLLAKSYYKKLYTAKANLTT